MMNIYQLSLYYDTQLMFRTETQADTIQEALAKAGFLVWYPVEVIHEGYGSVYIATINSQLHIEGIADMIDVIEQQQKQ